MNPIQYIFSARFHAIFPNHFKFNKSNFRAIRFDFASMPLRMGGPVSTGDERRAKPLIYIFTHEIVVAPMWAIVWRVEAMRKSTTRLANSYLEGTGHFSHRSTSRDSVTNIQMILISLCAIQCSNVFGVLCTVLLRKVFRKANGILGFLARHSNPERDSNK